MNLNMSPHYEPDDEKEVYYNMPLKKGKSKAAIKSNIKTEMAHGKSQKQAIAISMNEARKTKKKKRGK